MNTLSPRRALRELPVRTPIGDNTDPTHRVVSPDEEIIRIRNLLRDMPMDNEGSPTLTPTHVTRSFFRTPTKILSPLKCPATPVRSSPRKRLVLDPTCDDMSEPKNKKLKLDGAGPSSALEIKMMGLSQMQLVQLVRDLMISHPQIRKEVEEKLPEPDLQPLENKLNELRKNVYKAFPRKCWGSTSDSFCFTRVRTHLEAFKKECVAQGQVLLESHQWVATLEYVISAWRYVKLLPDWEDPANNTIKAVCFRNLASQCMTSLKKQALSKENLQKIIESLKKLAEDSPSISPCLIKAQVLLDRMQH